MMKKMKGVSLKKLIGGNLLTTFCVISLTATFAFAVQQECEKVELCHQPEYITIILEVTTGVNGQNICVDDIAINDHLGHGDALGPCVTSPAN